MNLITIPALQDNYIWLLVNPQQECLIVDPGVATGVLKYLDQYHLAPKAILLTHHHHDHVGGVSQILSSYPTLKVYGPQETQGKGTNAVVTDQDSLAILGLTFQVLSVPGHTLGHIAYYAAPYLFCGDTLFSAGCGRLFEGTPQQMYTSLQRLALLPDSTLVCCAHEYTEVNLRFAKSVLPENQAIAVYQQQIALLRSQQQPSLPVLLHKEKQINPFLLCENNELQKNIGFKNQPHERWQVFARLRNMKDSF